MVKSVVLITSGQPSCNPRIVKEASAFHKAGYNVMVIYSFFVDWAEKEDRKLLKDVEWNFKLVGGSPSRSRITYFLTRLRFKLARILNKSIGNGFSLAERSQARCYDELLKAARRIKADWYIGHNLGALAVAVKAAKHNHAQAGFDFEDYHRGEGHRPHDLNRIIFLENKYVPHLKYISAASSMIAHRVAAHFQQLPTKIITLLNCFPLKQQPPFRKKSESDKTLQLFWFSQTIGVNRGLENLIEALIQLNDPQIHLTLAGKCNGDFQQYFDRVAKEIKERIHFAGIVSPDELLFYASTFDVGLALELQTPENRDICLTNKVFTYLIAGNALVMSETAMQAEFNRENRVGLSFKSNDVSGLKRALVNYKNESILEDQRKYNYALSNSKFHWERESEKLLVAISGNK
jgi:glycosyltransferase involved in cell wall biosynthesis